jgi:hypothetical protein
LHHFAVEGGGRKDSAQPVLLEETLRAEIAARRVVLMQRVHRHTIHRRARAFGQGFPKRVMSLIADAHPVECAKHDWIASSQQYHTTRRERRDDLLHRFHRAIAKR